MEKHFLKDQMGRGCQKSVTLVNSQVVFDYWDARLWREEGARDKHLDVSITEAAFKAESERMQ